MCAMYAQQGPPPVTEANYEVMRKLDYADDADARAAWDAGQGIAPVCTKQVRGRNVLRMPANFKGTDYPRTISDLSIRLDLST